MTTVTTSPLWEILVPHKMGKHDNSNPQLARSNKNVPVPYHQIWDEYVRDLTGGLTINKVSQGHWIDKSTNKLYKELMIPVRIACTREQIDQIAEYTMEHYQQLAVFVTLISETTLIFHKNQSLG